MVAHRCDDVAACGAAGQLMAAVAALAVRLRKTRPQMVADFRAAAIGTQN